MKQRNNAKETRTLRGRRGQAGTHQVECLCDMHGCYEAEVTPQVKVMGSLGRVKAPALQAERDILFDKYLRAYDNYQRWKAKAVNVYCTNYAEHDYKPMKMHDILKRHLEDISDQLRTYDDRINAAKTTGPLLYC